MNKVTFEKDSVIFREGDPGAACFEVLKGSVSIYSDWGGKRQQVLSTITVGSGFGEMGVLESEPRSATAVASEQTELLEIKQEELKEYLQNQKNHALLMMQGLGSHLRARTKDFTDVRSVILEAEEKENRKKEGLLKRLMYFFDIYERNQNQLSEPVPEDAQATIVEGPDGRNEAYAGGDIIFKEGETSRDMLILREGAVSIYSNYGTPEQNLLTTLQPGSFFGEMGLIDGEPRSATAVAAASGAQVQRVGAEELDSLMQSSPDLVMGILHHLSARLRQLTTEYLQACKAAGTVAESVRFNREWDAETKRLLARYAEMSNHFNFY